MVVHSVSTKYKGRPNFSDLTRLSYLQPPSTPPTRPPRFFLLLLLRLYGAPRHRSFFNILLSSYEDEARENARFNRVKWILEIFSGGGYLPPPKFSTTTPLVGILLSTILVLKWI